MLLYFSVSKSNLDTDCISLYLEAASLYLPSIKDIKVCTLAYGYLCDEP